MAFHVMNARNLAVSEYTGPSFLAITEHGGKLYAITTTTFVEFTGADDGGVAIEASIKTGKMDFGGDTIKQTDTVYFNGTASEAVTLTTTTSEDGSITEHAYTVDAYTGTLYERRVLLSRGVRSRWWQFEIENTNGGTLEVRDLKALVAPTSRRLQ